MSPRLAVVALSSRLWLADLVTGEVVELPTVAPVIDLRPDRPNGGHLFEGGDGPQLDAGEPGLGDPGRDLLGPFG